MNQGMWIALAVVIAVVLLIGARQMFGGGPGKLGPDGKPLPFQRINGEQARALVSEGAALIDVRSPGEFSGGHLDGAKNLPVQRLSNLLDDVGPKDQAVIVYCASGIRSHSAMDTLRQAGFTKVYDLGSIRAW